MSLGDQIHINHVDCPAGLDIKKRLYIKKVVGGLVAFCQHCREAGFQRELSADGTLLRKWLTGKEKDMPRVSKPGMWPKLHDDIRSIDILDYLHNYHIEVVYNINFCETDAGQLAMKLRSYSGTTYGLQIRTFSLPKYMTYYANGWKDDAAWFGEGTIHSDTLVITEDYISAYRVYRDTGCDSVALLKTTMSKYTEECLLKANYKRIIVWLDPDEAGVKGERKITQRLRYITGTEISPACWDQEPKELDPRTLKRVLNGL